MYIWKLPDWPRFSWDHDEVAKVLAQTRHEQGRLLRRMESLGFQLREEAVLRPLTQDVFKTSEIEGEARDPDQVRSSIARRLGMGIGRLTPTGRDLESIVEMMLDATRQYDQPLTEKRLFGWYASLFPAGRKGLVKIRAGTWRNDRSSPMQVVSGAINHERIHHAAPPAGRLAAEMPAFLDWFNEKQGMDPALKASVAHLWFATIHPSVR
jgi:Fic family protein